MASVVSRAILYLRLDEENHERFAWVEFSRSIDAKEKRAMLSVGEP
jgi:hypothetical protein